MGASKRSNYSAANNRRNAGSEAARNLGVVLGLGGLSFFLGFFVLSRMVPDKHEASGFEPAVAATAHDAASMTIQTPVAAPEPHRAVAPSVVTTAPKRDSKGPILEQDVEPATQPAGSLEKPGNASPADTTNTADPTDKSQASGANATADTNVVTGTNSEAGSPSSTTERSGRHSRATTPDTSVKSSGKSDTGGFSQDDQKPSRIDRESSSDTSTRSERHDEAGSSSARSERNADTADETPRTVKTVKRIRYSVRGSAYSRREAAEREVRRITDLGLDATVVPITNEEGTTVYRVQQGVYRNRSNAEKAKTKLSEAGVEAEIVRSTEKE